MNREQYLQRVRSTLGEGFFSSHVAVWGLGLHYLAAEALARTGVGRQTWFNDGVAGGAFCSSLGHDLAGMPRAEALRQRCVSHNPLLDGAGLETRPRRLEGLEAWLTREQPALLIASGHGGPEEAGRLVQAATSSGTPLIMTFVPRAAPAECVQLVWGPGSAADVGELRDAAVALAALPRLELDRPEHHPVGLEARSMALGLARWILSPEAPRRPDLEGPLLIEGRGLVVRGRPEWPWSTLFLRPAPEVVSRLCRSAAPRYAAPMTLLGRQRLLVLGLGTASLFCAESGLLAPHLCLLDGGEVSPFNPVRQVYGAALVGQPKHEALASVLRQRLEPDATWDRSEDGPLSVWRTAARSVSHARLRLSLLSEGSAARFEEVLDLFRPTLAVVGMGRSKDDNFTATAALRRRGIPHITPTAFPAVTHFKHILTDGEQGPCYDCIQGHLPLDLGAGPTLAPAEREIFYGGTQPATLAETLPSAHSLLRLSLDLAMPRPARPPYLRRELNAERVCFVGANRAERREREWLYGVDRPFGMVTYGVEDLLGGADERRCRCGRTNKVES